MAGFAFAAAYALFVWWFSTGLIILLDNLPRAHLPLEHGRRGTALFAVSLWRLRAAQRRHVASTGAYAAFTYAVLAWGWQEMSFFMGFVTGPRRTGCPPDCRGARHFLARRRGLPVPRAGHHRDRGA